MRVDDSPHPFKLEGKQGYGKARGMWQTVYLEARGGDLKGFAIAGADGKFVWANAKIVGNDKIELSSSAVKQPTAVRFGWANYPVVNLWNKDGLPAHPFRTDSFPLTTLPKPPAPADAKK